MEVALRCTQFAAASRRNGEKNWCTWSCHRQWDTGSGFGEELCDIQHPVPGALCPVPCAVHEEIPPMGSLPIPSTAAFRLIAFPHGVSL